MSGLNHNRSLVSPFERRVDLQPILSQLYVWMGLGTLLTSALAYITNTTSLAYLAANPIIVMIAVFSELGIASGMSLGLYRLSFGAAVILFFAYSALNGFTISLVLLAFSRAGIVSAFAAAAILFCLMSLIGHTAQVDLTRTGTYMVMGVLGLVLAVIVSLFINTSAPNMLISMVGVLSFTAFAAINTRNITQIANQDREATARTAILGALYLYLGPISLLLHALHPASSDSVTSQK